jgi:hypothetical protein
MRRTVAPRFISHHPGGNLGANLESISHRCYCREVEFEWELTQETIYLPLGCFQGGKVCEHDEGSWRAKVTNRLISKDKNDYSLVQISRIDGQTREILGSGKEDPRSEKQ